MEENKRNKDVEKLMAHDDSARININKVSHHDRGRYINAKAWKYKIWAKVILILGIIIGTGFIVGGGAIMGAGSDSKLSIGAIVLLVIGIIIIIASLITSKLLYGVKVSKITEKVYEGKY